MSESPHDCIVFCCKIHSYINRSLLPVSVLIRREDKKTANFLSGSEAQYVAVLKIICCLAVPCTFLCFAFKSGVLAACLLSCFSFVLQVVLQKQSVEMRVNCWHHYLFSATLYLHNQHCAIELHVGKKRKKELSRKQI